jgi:hypothetical protein
MVNLLKLRKYFGLGGIPNECLKHHPRRPMVHLTHSFNYCLRLSNLPKSWKEAKVIPLPKPRKDPKFPQNLCPISISSTTAKVSEKFILKIVLLGASQFGFRAITTQHFNV